MEYKVTDGNVLLKAVEYDLMRSDGRIVIRVREIVAGHVAEEFRFMAQPWLIRPSKDEYVGFGNSEPLALQDCLAKIKDVSFDEIFGIQGA